MTRRTSVKQVHQHKLILVGPKLTYWVGNYFEAWLIAHVPWHMGF